MFELKSNQFVDSGFCLYEDEYGNTIRCTRTENGFNLKPGMKDRKIKALTIVITLPLTSSGCDLRFESGEAIDTEREDIQALASGVGEIVNRWCDMLTDISFLSCDNDFLKRAYPGVDDEEISKSKMYNLMKYEELKSITDCIGSLD